MAVREAGIRVTMKKSGFSAGLQDLVKRSKSAGSAIGAALSGPMKAGFAGARGAMKSLFSDLSGHMKTAATLGGAFAVGNFIKDAIEMQGVYRNLAHDVSKVDDSVRSWRDVQAMIAPVADKTGQTIQDMTGAFSTVFGATGDLEYTKGVLEAVGVAATATGKKAEEFGQLAQIAYRKFGVEVKDIPNMLAGVDAQLGIGGASLETIGAQFGEMATEANNAGFKGAEGMVQLTALMRQLDNEIGEKAVPSLKIMFEMLKTGTTQSLALQKNGRFKFSADMTAIEKIRETLKTVEGRKAAELVFTGDARRAYDSLVKPFDRAANQAKANGAKAKEVTEAGLKAFDDTLANMSNKGRTFASLQDAANKRMAEDPSVVMKQALNKMSVAFQDPRMMNSIERLAKSLPKVADGFVRLMDFALKHPLLAAGGYAGARMAIGFAEGAIMKAGAQIGGWASATMQKAAPTTGAKIGLAAKFALIAAAAYIGYEIGKAAIDRFSEGKNKDEANAFGGEAQASAAARSKNMGVDQKEKILSGLRGEIGRQKAKGDTWGNYFGETYEGAAAAVSVAAGWQTQEDANKRTQSREDNIARLQAAEKALVASIERQKSAKDAESGSVKTASDSARKMAQAFDQAADAAKKLSTASGGKGGPPAPLPNAPGHDAPR